MPTKDLTNNHFRLYVGDSRSVVDGYPIESAGIPLYANTPNRKQGVFLPEVPNIGWLIDKQQHHSAVVGVAGGIWQATSRGVMERSMRLRIKGEDVQKQANDLLDVLGDGNEYFYLFVRNWSWDEEDYLTKYFLPCRLKSVDAPEWNGWVTQSALLDMQVNFVLDSPLWRMEKQVRVWEKFNAAQVEGQLPIYNIQSGEPLWPVIKVTGGFGSCHVRLHTSDEWQAIPPGGGVIITNPAERATLTLAGKHWNGFKPHWSQPVSPRNPHILIDAQAIQSNFKVEMTVIPMTWRAW